MRLDDFREIWCVDFEFSAPPGERPSPICLVAQEFRSGRTIHLWEGDLHRRDRPPYPTDASCLFVAYYASAEIGCHLALGWSVPARVLDLFVEFRNHTNGRQPPCGSSLLGALVWFGLDGIAVAEKEEMRQLALRGGPWTGEEREALLTYCESDVVALIHLLPRLAPHLDLARALLRGRYMVAAARMEYAGLPIDVPALARLQARWTAIEDQLIARIDCEYGVYEGRIFKMDRFARWLEARGIPWPRTPTGALSLDDEETFRPMARIYPAVAPLRELRYALG
jgi:DNA polymerase I